MAGTEDRKNNGAYMLSIKVVPGSSREAIEFMDDDTLKVKVTKPAHKGQANAACIKLLARSLGLRAADVELAAGGGSPRKTIRVFGCPRPPLDLLRGRVSGR